MRSFGKNAKRSRAEADDDLQRSDDNGCTYGIQRDDALFASDGRLADSAAEH